MATATQTKERAIDLSGEMVTAIMNGRKTQHREIVKPQPFKSEHEDGVWLRSIGRGGTRTEYATNVRQNETVDTSGSIAVRNIQEVKLPVDEWLKEQCPYKVGMELWVREPWQTWAELNSVAPSGLDKAAGGVAYPGINYLANGNVWDAHKRPPMHMPRWASRLTLEITDVRVQRVQEINAVDALEEGIPNATEDDPRVEEARQIAGGYDAGNCELARLVFRDSWNALNAKRGYPWADNPWVWRITFRKVNDPA